MPEINGSSFRLITLGSPRLEIDEVGSEHPRIAGPGKNLAILAYLALAPGRGATRDRLCDLLWGDRDLGRSRPQLRQTLWLIRSQIGADVVNTVKDRVSLNPRVWFDVEDFLAAIRENNFHRAVQIYEGDFFSDFASPGSANFEEWASLERTRLRRMFVACAESLMKTALDAGHFGHSLEIAKRVRQLEPDGQTGWRMLIEARLASGDRIGAQGDAEQLEEWLEREDWSPEPATRAILQATRESQEPLEATTEARDVVAELIGRGREFAVIHDAWIEAPRRGARLIHLMAPSGMGKTRLLRDVCSRIRSEGGRTRYVRANYGERSIPFSFAAAVASALATAPGAGGIAPATARTLVSLNPTLSSRFVASTERMEQLDSRRVGLAILELISAIGDEEPIAVGLDDFQWSDIETREALVLVMSRLKSQHVLFLTASRSGAAAPAGESARVLKLAPLKRDEVAQLLASIGRLPDESWAGEFVAALAASSNGVPLHILDAIRSSLDHGLLQRTGSELTSEDPVQLIAAVGRAQGGERFHSLPEGAQTLLRILSIAGTPLRREVAAQVIGNAGQQFNEHVSLLELGGFVAEEDSSLIVAHDSITESLVSSTSQDVTADINVAIGRALATSHDGSLRRRAIRYLLAGGDFEQAAEVASPFLQVRPRGVSLRDGIAALSGSVDSESLALLERRLPVSVRMPTLKRYFSISGTIVVAAFLLSAMMLRRAPSDAGVVLTLVSGDAHSPRVADRIDLSSNDWIEAIRRADGQKGYRSQGHIAPRPGRDEWADYVPFPDSGGGDIALVAPGRPLRRLTYNRGEDAPASFSPDGKSLLILTTRWNSEGWYEIGVLDIETNKIQRLTFDSARYTGAWWSPDGSRVVTIAAGTNTPRICIMDSDGTNHWCLDNTKIGDVRSVCGWFDADQLIISVRVANQFRWFLLNSATLELTPTAIPATSDIRVDQTGKWAAARGDDGSGWIIGPVMNNGGLSATSRTVRFAAYPVFSIRKSLIYSDSVAIISPPELAVRVPLQLRVNTWRKDGTPTPTPIVRWRSLSPSTATIDTLGIVTGLRAGSATIEASLGGWRRAVTRVEVNVASSTPVMTEDWSGDAFKRWRAFGAPLPRIVDTTGGRFLSINGDDLYFSGAYFSRGFDASRGIAIELDASTPINRMKWQLLLAGFFEVNDAHGLRKWDHRTGYISGFLGNQGCNHTFPHGEGEDAIRGIAWLPGMKAALGQDFRIDDGTWHRIQLQYFPDGRCGLAINGQAVAITRGTPSPPKSLVAYVQGMSAGTDIRVGRVTARTGILSGIDWTVLKWNGDGWLR
jgi:DNA-binding SARP family transcriptional activator